MANASGNESIWASAGLADQWYVVAETTDLDAARGPIAVGLLGGTYVVWRGDDGAPTAAPDRCPHREAPLSLGRIEHGCLVCPYHGWTFDRDGRCVAVPSSGAGSAIASAGHLRTLPIRERYGLVWISPGTPSGEPPHIPQDGDPSFRRLNSGVETWAASATRMVDNFCDVAHFPWVHAGTIGSDTDPVVAPVTIEPLDADFTGYQYTVEVHDEHGDDVRQRMSTGFHLPFLVRSNTTFETGRRAGHDRVLLLCTTPIDGVNSLFTFVSWRNHDHDVLAADALAFDRAIGDEDRAMLERIPGELPLDNSSTVSVRSDRLSVEWRRQLASLVAGADSTT